MKIVFRVIGILLIAFSVGLFVANLFFDKMWEISFISIIGFMMGILYATKQFT